MATDRRRKRFDPTGGGLRSRPAPDDDDDEPSASLEDQFSRLERARKSIEATFWYLEIEAPGAPAFRQGLLGKRLLIGRDASCNLPLRSAGVSRQHALLEHDEERDCWRISDAGSHNGTYVNGRRIREPTLLGPADTVHVGDWRMRLRADSNDDRRELLRFATLRITSPLPGLGGRAPDVMPDRLVVVAGPAPRKEIRLDEGPVRLGPVKGSSLVPEGDALADVDVEVGPLPEPGTYELVVRGEGGLVSVNDAPVRQRRLAPGDRLRLGRGADAVSLEFRSSEPAQRGGGGRGAPSGRPSSTSDVAPEPGPSSETTPTETRSIDLSALAKAVAAADAADRARPRLEAKRAPASTGGGDAPAAGEAAPPAGEPAPPAGEPAPPAGDDTPALYVRRDGKLEPVPWAAELGLVASSSPAAAPKADETPEPPTPTPTRAPPAGAARRRGALGFVLALMLGAVALSAAATLMSARGDRSRGDGPGPLPYAATQTSALEPADPALAPSAVASAPEAASAANSAGPAADDPGAAGDAPSAPSAASVPSAPSAPSASSARAAPSGRAAPRPDASPGRKPRGAGGGDATDPESEARMREFLCRQKGKCD